MDYERFSAAAAAVAGYWGADASRLAESADGLALLALLCNAAAKENPSFYEYKDVLVEAAVRAARPGSWWVDTHRYPRAVTFTPFQRVNKVFTRWNGLIWEKTGWSFSRIEEMAIFFIETQLRLDGDTLQISFHFPGGQPLPGISSEVWPASEGRGWRGQRAQARAAEILRDWLSQ